MDRRRTEAFRVLGIPVDSDQEAVLDAYRRLARATHPDVSADPDAGDRFATLAAAYRLASRGREAAPGPASDPRPGPAPSAARTGRFTRGPDSGPDQPLSAGPAKVTPSGAPGGTPGRLAGQDSGRIPVRSSSGTTRRPAPDAPIVAGPVFVSPLRRSGPEGSGRG
ncbi:MAG: DnaJ domain-containing protein [Nocardioides sp.]|uniref:J domain-containing protein n=1 Tax=Nocardioides sp. TaxID=35761 RepID=UPI0039E529CA